MGGLHFITIRSSSGTYETRFNVVVGSASPLGLMAVHIVNADDWGPIPKSLKAATLNYHDFPTLKTVGSESVNVVRLLVVEVSVYQVTPLEALS